MTAEQVRMALEYARLTARRSFVSYLVNCDPNYKMRWFHRVIAERCQMLADGEIRKLMIFCPPQHGKSRIVSQEFPAWLLGVDPRAKIVACSYSSNLSSTFCRSVQRTIDSDAYAEVFGERTAQGLKRTSDFFDAPGGGFYKAVGVCGSLTGTPADVAIIDDPVKDALEAYSSTYRERVWEWYNSVLTTRLHNGSRQIFIMTRWHEDDLAGRILKAEGGEWDVLSIPAICEEDGDGALASGRKVGEPLWPQRHSLERLLEQRERSPRTFSALYQQNPIVQEGNIVISSWFRRVKMSDYEREKYGRERKVVFFVDTAYTDKSGNDPTGIIAADMVGETLYILHGQKVRLKFPDLVRFIQTYAREHGYNRFSSIRIEPKANGLSVIDQLREGTGLNVAKTPTPTESKETRLCAASPAIECGRVALVEGEWTDEFVDEVCGFPAKAHDEYVDVLCYAVSHFLSNGFRTIDAAGTARKVY